MAVSLTVNGTIYAYPQTGDPAPWGDAAYQWAQAVTAGMLQKAGGNFTLTADANFGPNFGLQSQYYKSRTANVSATGIVRLANVDTISWRNIANAADVALNASAATDGVLQYGAVDLVGTTLTQTLTNKTISGSSNTLTNVGDAALSTSYVKADGSRPLTANWAIGGFNLVMGGGAVTGFGTLVSNTANSANTGALRLGNLDKVSWRNAGNTANVDLFVDASNVLNVVNNTAAQWGKVYIQGEPTNTTPALMMRNVTSGIAVGHNTNSGNSINSTFSTMLDGYQVNNTVWQWSPTPNNPPASALGTVTIYQSNYEASRTLYATTYTNWIVTTSSSTVFTLAPGVGASPASIANNGTYTATIPAIGNQDPIFVGFTHGPAATQEPYPGNVQVVSITWAAGTLTVTTQPQPILYYNVGSERQSVGQLSITGNTILMNGVDTGSGRIPMRNIITGGTPADCLVIGAGPFAGSAAPSFPFGAANGMSGSSIYTYGTDFPDPLAITAKAACIDFYNDGQLNGSIIGIGGGPTSASLRGQWNIGPVGGVMTHNVNGALNVTGALNSGAISIGSTTPSIALRSTTTLAGTGQSYVIFGDTGQDKAYLGYDGRHDNKMRLSFYGSTGTTVGNKALLMSHGNTGDSWVLDTDSITSTGDITAGSAVIINVPAAVTAKILPGSVLYSGTQLADKISVVNSATVFTVVTGGAYPTGGGTIADQDTGTLLTYTAYNAGTKQFTVASTAGLLANDTTYCSVGIPLYATVSSVGATTLTMDRNAVSTVTGLTFYSGNPSFGNLTMATAGTRAGVDNGVLNLYGANPLSNPQAGILYLHNNDPYHTPGRTCGITFFGDGPLNTRGVGPAGCPIGTVNFYVENDNPGPVGSGNMAINVCDGTTYRNAMSSDHTGNVTLGSNASTSQAINGILTVKYNGTQTLKSDNFGDLHVGSAGSAIRSYGSALFLNYSSTPATTSFITTNSLTGAVAIGGGNSTPDINSAGVYFYASTHATKANKIEFYNNAVISATATAAGAWNIPTLTSTTLTVTNLQTSGLTTLGGTLAVSGYGITGVNNLQSSSANISGTGMFRLANTDIIGFRNFGNAGDNLLGTSVADRLTYNTAVIPTISSADTLTNKTISGATNTLSSIAYASLSLTGSIVNADLAGAVSIAKGGTGQTTAPLGFAALSPQTTKGDLIVYGSSPARLSIGADGQVPVADSAQPNGLAWKTLQQGSKNYITYNNFENNSTIGWALGHISGALTNSLPVTGTNIPTFGSGSTSLAISTISAGQLAGTYSLSYAASAATTVGDMLASSAYTIDAEDQAKVLSWKFYYKLSSGAANFPGTSSNSFAVAIWDATNSTWLGTAGQFSMVQSSGVGICQGTFQTASNTASLQLVVYNCTVTTGAATLYLDDFYLGPQSLAFGPAMSDWTAYTPTGGWTTNTTYSGYYRRVGDSMEITAKALLTGAPNAASLTINIPSGFTIDTTKLFTSGSASGVILARASGSHSGSGYIFSAQYSSTSSVLITYQSSVGANGAAVDATNPLTWASTDEVEVVFVVPITGWSSNTAMSADTDTRVCAFAASTPTATVTGVASDVSWTSITDTHAGFNGTTTYTTPVTGWYDVEASLRSDATYAAGNDAELYINASGSTLLEQLDRASGAQTSMQLRVRTTRYFVAGTPIKIQISNSGTSPSIISGTTWASFTIFRLSGPAVAAATESVNMRYTTSAGSTLTKSATNIVTFATKDYDSHSAWNGTDTYTCPVSGVYRVSTSLLIASGLTWAAGDYVELDVLKNGSAINSTVNPQQASHTTFATGLISCSVKCVAGDALKIQCFPQKASTGNVVLNNSGSNNWLCIEREGN